MPREREVEAEVVGEGKRVRRPQSKGRTRASPNEGLTNLNPDDFYGVLESISESLEDITMEDGLGDALLERFDLLTDILERFAENGGTRSILTPAVETFTKLFEAGRRARQRRQKGGS